jgi:hypothetical protein
MSKVLKALLLFSLVTFVIWVAVLWHWEATHRNMTVADIVTYLGLLPLAVCGLLLALRWAWLGAAERADTAAAQPAPTPGAATPSHDEAQRHATVQVLGAHICSAGGQAPGELLEAAQAGKPRPDLDRELRSDDGLPVMCARIADLDIAQAETALEPLVAALRTQREDWASFAPASHVVRALAALQTPLLAALADLQPWAETFGAAGADGLVPPAHSQTPTLLRVLLGWPPEWSEFEQTLGLAWARSLLDSDSTTIPPSRVVFDAHACSGEELWLKADQLLQALARDGRDDVLLLAACHSAIGDAAVAALEQQRRLFSAADHPKGLMPGEAAATLVLAPPQWPVATGGDKAPVLLHRPSVQRRDKSVEAGGRVSPECLSRALAQALIAGRLDAAQVGALVCDADQHTPRSTELFGTTLDLLPHLDPTEDMRLIGTINGHTGPASALLVVAAAAERARGVDKPCIALVLGDAFMRMALLARTAAVPLPAGPAP